LIVKVVNIRRGILRDCFSSVFGNAQSGKLINRIDRFIKRALDNPTHQHVLHRVGERSFRKLHLLIKRPDALFSGMMVCQTLDPKSRIKCFRCILAGGDAYGKRLRPFSAATSTPGPTSPTRAREYALRAFWRSTLDRAQKSPLRFREWDASSVPPRMPILQVSRILVVLPDCKKGRDRSTIASAGGRILHATSLMRFSYREYLGGFAPIRRLPCSFQHENTLIFIDGNRPHPTSFINCGFLGPPDSENLCD